MEKRDKVAKKQLSPESILGSKNKIKLLRWLVANNGWQFNLARISNEINIHKGSISKIISEFELNNILNVRRNGKLLLLKLNEENEITSELIIPFFKREGEMKWGKM